MKKRFLVAVTGGISAYKSASIISALLINGHDVKVIATDNASNFVTTNVLNVISKDNYITETPGETKHIDLAKWCDIFLMVPATANTIAKISNGLADNLVTTSFLALPKDKIKIICPAMNTMMWENEATITNIEKIKKFSNLYIIEPAYGQLACGDIGAGKLPKTREIISEITKMIEVKTWSFPLVNPMIGPTKDSFSYLDFDWRKEVQIPVNSHVGSFGVRRKHDIHKGIDLYAEVGTSVYAVEDGFVCEVCPFTGEIAGFPWWENTYGVYVEGDSGVVVYGEILPEEGLKEGDIIEKGQLIGTVLRVLKKDNGRPLSMLHLELHKRTHLHIGRWEIGEELPEGYINPTEFLLKSTKLTK